MALRLKACTACGQTMMLGRSKRRCEACRLAGMSPACYQALLLEGEVRNAAIDAGLVLRVSQSQVGQNAVLHWQFNDENTGNCVLNYWPGNGTWAAPSGGEGEVADAREALEEARRVAIALAVFAPLSASLLGLFAHD